jgi:hypothetical protein
MSPVVTAPVAVVAVVVDDVLVAFDVADDNRDILQQTRRKQTSFLVKIENKKIRQQLLYDERVLFSNAVNSRAVQKDNKRKNGSGVCL